MNRLLRLREVRVTVPELKEKSEMQTCAREPFTRRPQSIGVALSAATPLFSIASGPLTPKRRFLRAVCLAGLAAAALALAAPPASAHNTDGCSWSRETGTSFDFTDECHEHDHCWHGIRGRVGTIKNDRRARDDCDSAFMEAMYAECLDRWSGWDPRRQSCMLAADVRGNGVHFCWWCD